MKKTIIIFILTFILFTATGCSPVVNRYRVSVDAITHSNQNIAPTTYTIKALGEETDENSLEFQRQSQQLIKILNQQGYQQVNHSSLAQQTIFFDYGLEKIKEQTRTYSEPDVSFGISWGFPYGYYNHRYHPYWSNYGYTSYRTYRKTYRLFNRYIVILSKEQSGKELWRVDISSIGESNNLKKIVPILLRASVSYLGTNTKEPIELVVDEQKNRDKKE
ncbi:MAG TPA: hypothetical protein EYG67_02110 [Campylobacterales bacterium]|nr:hypothetical protein [Campylobacterales bacterium]